jgi:GTP-binding protein
VSKTPGRTQLINFFSLGERALLVDLPGYGFAGVPGAVRAHWETLVGEYIGSRPSIALVVIVMDMRHPLTPLDLRLIDWLKAAGRRAHVLITKADKLSRQEQARTLGRVRASLAKLYPGATVQAFSSSKREGLEAAGAALARAVEHFGSAQNKSPG